MKNWAEVPAKKLITNEVLEKLWTYLIVDFNTKLPLVAGKDAILAVTENIFWYLINFPYVTVNLSYFF